MKNKKVVASAQDARIALANKLLVMAGSCAATEALMFACSARREQARKDADHEMHEYWAKIVDILWVAKNKIAEVK